jgi:hypothetical protein
VLERPRRLGKYLLAYPPDRLHEHAVNIDDRDQHVAGPISKQPFLALGGFRDRLQRRAGVGDRGGRVGRGGGRIGERLRMRGGEPNEA